MDLPPGWYHNVIQNSTALRPVVYIDLLPFREQLITSLNLSQQFINGPRYALHKWMAHAHAAVTLPLSTTHASSKVTSSTTGELPTTPVNPSAQSHAQSRSDGSTGSGGDTGHSHESHGQGKANSNQAASGRLAEQLRHLDPGWAGELFLEMEGTAEALHDLIVRLAGPHASSVETRNILASVLDPRADPLARKLPMLRDQAPRAGLRHGSVHAAQNGSEEQETPYAFPFHILREKCAPGKVVVYPLFAGKDRLALR